MRILVLLAGVLAVAAIGYLLWDPAGGERRPDRTGVEEVPDEPDQPADPKRLATGDLIAEVRAAPRAAQDKLSAYVDRCVGRGAAAVPELVAFLRDGDDVDCGRTWQVIDGKLQGYPTLRAAFVHALCRIEGPEAAAALHQLVETTRSGGEAYLAALSLRDRGETGWAPALLNLVGAEDEDPRAEATQGPMVELVATTSPEIAARRLEDRAPRGKGKRSPGALARVLTHVPWDMAQRSGARLLEDEGVSAKAKARYVDAILRRPEPEAMRVVREAIERGGIPKAMHRRVREVVVDSPAFAGEARQFRAALRAGDEATATALRAKAERRVREGRAVLEAMFGTLESAQAKAAVRRLEAKLTRFQ